MPEEIIQFYGWQKGLINRTGHPLLFPREALSAGQNVLLANGGLEVRKGYSIVAQYIGTPDVKEFSQIVGLWQVRFAGINKSYLLAQTYGTQGNVDNSPHQLIVLSETLPPASMPADFTGLMNLGVEDGGTWSPPGVCDVAVLGDRAVITEGITNQPLVFPGCQDSSAATDWATPKQVLVSREEGAYEYDITSGVCDGDTSTTANVANIAANGALHIIPDLPRVIAFHFEMGTVNSLSAGEASPFSKTLTFDAATKWTQRDLKATIDHWVEDTPGAGTGHFENAANAPLTLGAGNDCPDVEAGLLVVFADNSQVAIQSITSDGELADEVELDSTVASQDVTAIYGLVQAVGKVQTSVGNAVWSTIFDRTTDAGDWYRMSSPGNYQSFRQVVTGAELGAKSRLRFTLQNGNTTNDIEVYPTAYFGVRSGTTKNFSSTPSAVTFSTLSGPLGPGESAISDVLTFTTAPGSNYLFALSVEATPYVASNGYTYHYLVQSLWAPGGTYYAANAATTPDSGALVPTGYENTLYSHSIVKKIEAAGTPIVPAGLFVMESASGVDIGGAEAFLSTVFSESTPGSTVTYWAFSFDNQQTYVVWTGTAAKIVVQYDSGTSAWQYWNGAAFAASTENSRLGALAQAMGVAANKVEASTYAAMDDADWATFGWVAYAVSRLHVGIGLLASGTDIPSLTSLTANIADAGVVAVEVNYNGQWIEQVCTDGTAVANVPLAQSGNVVYTGGTYMEASYATINGLPGFHYRVKLPGTSNDCSITKITYSAPLQDLQNIGVIGAEKALEVLWEDVSEGALTDMSDQMADNDHTELSAVTIPLDVGDRLYVCGLYPYNEIDVVPLTSNTQAVTLSGEYYDGAEWVAMSMVDGTAVISGKTISGSGKLSFPLPADWQSSMPHSSQHEYGYWTRFTASGSVSTDTALVELRVYTVPPTLKKHRHAVSFAERMVLLDRPDKRNQGDISRELEEYGYTGEDSAADDRAWTAGSSGAIAACCEAWNSLVVFKDDGSAYILSGNSPQDFVSTRIETSHRLTPINSRCIVKAPMSGQDGERPALFILNQHGVFVISGVQSDANYGTMRAEHKSLHLNWWDDQTTEMRIDLNYLYLACGVYWPVKHQTIYAVPMIIPPATSQTSCNRLITYDHALQAWLPPMQFADVDGTGDLEIGSLCVVHHYNANAPNKVGDIALYAGVSGGGTNVYVVRLFDPEMTADDTLTPDVTTDISWSARTGWISDGKNDKRLRDVIIHGTSTSDVILKEYLDGSTTAKLAGEVTITELTGLSTTFGKAKVAPNVEGRYFQLELSGTGSANISGFDARFEITRDDMAV